MYFLFQRLFGAVALLCLFSIASAAAILKGKVTDDKGEILPYATVYVEGTTIGTTANAEGLYKLTLKPGTYKVICQFISFERKTATVTITSEGQVAEQNFSLREQAMQIKEVVVKANSEDPAYPIIRKTIKKRAEHLKQVKSFQAGVYLKGVLRLRETPKSLFGFKIEGEDRNSFNEGISGDTSGKGVVYFCEEIADYYAQQPDKERTVVHSVHESGDPKGLGFSQLPSVVTFYENNVRVWDEVTPRGMVSPIADGALNYYKYKLRGEFIENNKTIFKIEVTPKRLYEPLLSGFIYIVEDDWAIHSLSLTSHTKNGLQVIDTLRIDQVFLPLKPDVWVVKSQVLYPALSIIGFGVTGSFVTVYDKQKVNGEVPDSIFGGRVISTYDKTARNNDTAFWNEARMLPLEDDEQRGNRRKDSIYQVDNDPVKLEARRKARNKIDPMDVIMGGITHTGKGYRSSWNVNSLLLMTNYNTVEGLNFAPKFNYNRRLDTSSSLELKTALRYGVANTHFNAIGGLTYTRRDNEWRGRNQSVRIEGGKYVFQFNDENPVNQLYNTYSTLLYRQNYLKIYERWEGALGYVRNTGSGFSWRVRMSYQDRRPLSTSTVYNWGKGDRQFTPSFPTELASFGFEPHKAAIVKAGVSWRPGVHYVQYPDYKAPIPGNWPQFSLRYEKGIAGIGGSKTNFDKWRFGIADEFRMKLMGSVSYTLFAGGFLNDNYVSAPDLMHIYGNRYPLAAPYLSSFQLAPYYRFSNKEKLYGEAHVEYNLQGLLTNKIPGLRQAQWFLILGNNTFYASEKNFYTEAFLSVDNLGYKLFRVLRVDFVQGWDGAGETYTGVRVGLRLGSLIGVNLAESEWL